MRLTTFGIFLTLILILGLACSDNSTAPVDGDGAKWLVKAPDGGNTFPLELKPNIIPPSNYYKDEATDLAVWWSGELYAPEDLKQEIATELRKIRLEFSKTIPQTNIRFHPVYMSGRLFIGFTDAGWEMWKEGGYNAWDSLNAVYGVDSIKVTTHYPDFFKYVSVFFPDRPNVERLIEAYRDLPETEYIQGDILCCDWPILLMWRDDEIAHYFFRNAWGDCPSGCIYEEYDYVAVISGEPIYIGHYLHDWDHPMPRPDWMNLADRASDKYWKY